METNYYLVEEIMGGEYNIYSGTEEECNAEMQRIINRGVNVRPMFISYNRYN